MPFITTTTRSLTIGEALGKSVVCMAIQTVAAVKTELRNQHGKSIIAPRRRRVK